MQLTQSTGITIPAALEERLKVNCGTLQVMPEVARRAVEIARQPNGSLEEFCDLVNRDPRLAADFLRISNSALFATTQPVLALHQAVVRLGLRQCRNVIMGSCMAALTKSVTIPNVDARRHLCRHGFTTAVIASRLNSALGAGFTGEEFAAGLIHDFGRLLLAMCLPDRFTLFDPLSFDESESPLTEERATIGTNHCEVGAWFAVRNCLPNQFLEVMRFHHNPESARNFRRLVALVAVADQMANHLARGESAFSFRPSNCSQVSALAETGLRFNLIDCARDILTQAEDAADAMLVFE